MESKTFNIKKAKKFLKHKKEEQEKKRSELFQKAWQNFHTIVYMLIEKYHPKRIYQWGSLLNKRCFSEISDIDIAVEGITSPEKFFAMYEDAKQLTDFFLDLIQIEKIHPLHADNIKKRGKLVYERE